MAILRGTYYFNSVAGNYLIAKNAAGITKADGCKISNGQITRYVTESELLTPIEIEFEYSSAYINVEQFYGVLSLQKVVLDDSSWTIAENAFELSGLENIELGTGVYSVGANAFKNSKLKYITSRATTPPQIVTNSFNNIPTGGTLYYPAGSNYSTWLSTSPYYLGYYGWNGSEIVDEPTYPDGEVTVSYDTINISSNGDTLYYIIRTNNIQYLERFYTYADFITVTMIGEDVFPETTFKIEIAKNETLETRSGSVWFTYRDWNGNTISQRLGITQDAKYVEPEDPEEPEEPEEPDVSNKIICTYYPSYIAYGKICNSTDSFKDIIYNGESIGVVEEFLFPSIGEEYVFEFVLKDGTTIGSEAFRECEDLKSVFIPDSVTTIGNNAFEDCNYLEDVQFGSSLNTIGNNAFADCVSLNYINLPNSLTTIGDNAFRCSGLRGELVIPNSVTFIGNYAFYENYRLEDVQFGSSLNTIGSNAFGWCTGLTSVNIPDSVTTIGTYAFNNCENITEVHLGSGLTEINSYAFSCKALRKITITAKIAPDVDTDTFIGVVGDGGRLYYPAGSDYSSWLNKAPFLLGYYGWEGVEIGDVPPTPDEPSIDLEYNNITAPQGGITSTLDIETNGVEDIEIIAPDWVEVTDKGGYYEIEVLPNEGTDREGEVIFIGNPNKPNKVQQNIIITQKGDIEMATSIALYKTRLDFAATGGTGYVQVDYVNAQTINTPTCTQSWVTIEQTQSGSTTTNGQPTKQVQYRITMQPSSFARQTNITFSCTDSKGNTVSQNKFMLYQAAPALALPTITLEKNSIEFDSTGYAENFSVTVTYADTDTVLEPVVNGDWITVTEGSPIQGGNSGSGTAIVKRYLIEVSETEAYRQGTIVFKASNANGTSNSSIFSVIQNAPVEDEEIVPVISAYTKTATVKYDGSSTGIAITSLGCSYTNVTTVLEPVINGEWIHLGEGVLQSSLMEDTVVYRYPITFDTNSSVERIGYVTFKGTDEQGNEYTDTTKITQQAAPVVPDTPEPELPEDSDDITYSPIWKDVEYTFVDDTEYGIYYDRVYYFQGKEFKEEILLFKGKAYLPPDSDRVLVNINKICQNYMSENPNIFDGSVGFSHSFNEFKLKNGYGTLLHTYRFINDWSYKELTLGVKTNPIIPHIGDGQKLFFSAFATDKKSISWGMRYYDGTIDYNNTEYITNDFSTLVVTESRQKYVNTFYFGDKSFTVLPKCQCKYVLYYVNPYGGYDWLPITGKVVRKDKIETFVYTKNYNNTTADFGKNRYLANISVTYNLNTGWLTQEQSDRMWEVLESNTVWLHNLEEDSIYPVMITDTNIEHKQKFGKKRRLNYSINVELSHTRERV